MTMQLGGNEHTGYSSGLPFNWESRKKMRQRSLWLHTMLGVLVAGTALPGLAEAAVTKTDITPAAGFNTTQVKTEASGNVTTVTTSYVVKDTAINVFDTYQVAPKNVVNMYFGDKASSNNANLVNVVNSHIDIEGTVNAIKNKQIGGNMYFLSSDGMTVGPSGVINAGSLQVFTPTLKERDTLEGHLLLNNNGAATDQQGVLNALNPYMTATTDIPMNPEATIVVEGKINSTNNIGLHSANITVGDSVGKATLKTGVVDFKDVVNVVDENGNTLVNANETEALSGGLTAIKDNDSGDIVLESKTSEAITNGEQTINDAASVFNVGISTSDVTNGLTHSKYNASVAVDGELSAARDVTITATAKNGSGNQLASTTADITIAADSKITAGTDAASGGNVTMTATADNTYVDSESALHAGAITLMGALSPLKGDISYAWLDSSANISVDAGAVVTATKGAGGDGVTARAGDVDMEASSTLDASVGTTSQSYSLLSPKTTALPSGGLTFVKTSGEAAVTVKGTVTAAGDLIAKANSNLTVDSETINKLTSLPTGTDNSSQVVLSVAYLHGTNNATVDVVKDSTLTATAGNMTLDASTTNDVTNTVTVASGDASALVTAINITDYDNRANTNVYGTLSAGGNLEAKADNVVKSLDVSADNTIGSSKFMAVLGDTAAANLKENTAGLLNQLKTLGTNVKNALPFSLSKTTSTSTAADGTTTETEKSFSLGDYLSAGATITSGSALNSANVNIGDVAITAGGDVTISADSTIKDSHFSATGKSNSYKNDNKEDAVINASVLFADLNNYATVNIAKGTKTIKGKNVTVSSNAAKEYGRVTKMVNAVKDNYTALKTNVTSIKDIPDNIASQITELWTLVDSYEKEAESLKLNPDALTKADTWTNLAATGTDADGIISMGLAIQDKIQNIQKLIEEARTLQAGVQGAITTPVANSLESAMNMLSSITEFSKYENYADFMANSSSGAKAETPLTVAGNIAFTNIDNTAKVLVGSGRTVTADQVLALNAKNKATTVTLAGINSSVFGNKGGEASLGGTINVQDVDSDAIVAVAEKAALTANTINVGAGNDNSMYNVAMSAGKGDNAINGMFSYTSGESNALVAVDDKASLTANKLVGATAADNGVITLGSTNQTTVVNVAGGLAMGSDAAAVGAALAVNYLDVKNIAAIGDTAGLLSELWYNQADDGTRTLDSTAVASLGLSDFTTSTDGLTGSISAAGLNVTAETTGMVDTLSVAGSVVKGKSDSKKKDEGGLLNSLSNFKTNRAKNLANLLTGKSTLGKVTGLFETGLSKVNTAIAGSSKASDAMNVTGKDTSTGSETGTGSTSASNTGTQMGGGKVNVDAAAGGSGAPSFSIAGAGSLSVNALDNVTEAKVSGVTVNLNSGNMTVAAKDSALDMAASGAAAINWQKSKSSSGTSTALEGAIGLNIIDNSVKAVVENSTINNANAVTVNALSGGMEVALGEGLTISKSSSGSGRSFQGGASVSVNYVDHDVTALMTNTNVTAAKDLTGTAVDVTAYEGDVQVTGGGTVNVGNSNAMVGGAVSLAIINNNLNSSINGGSYTDLDSVKVQGIDSLVSIAAAATLGADFNSKGDAFQGAVLYNGLTNTIDANITNATIANAGAVSVTAEDAGLLNTEAAVYRNQLIKGINANQSEAENVDADTSGTSYYSALDTSNVKDDRNSNNKALDLNGNKSGSIIVSAAASLAGSGRSATGAAIGVDEITNSFSANISGGSITADTVNLLSDSDTFLIGVAGGVAASGKFGAMGSVSWQDISNNITSNITNAKITTNSLTAKATDNALAVNISGQVAASNKVAAGAVLNYNDLDNTTGVYLKGNTINAITPADGFSLDAEALSGAGIYSVGINVAASSSVALAGTVAINKGANNTEAIIDDGTDAAGKTTDSKLDNVKKTTVKTQDKTKLMSIVVGATGSGNTAVGAGVAYTAIGGASSDSNKAKQNVRAQINNSDITTVKGATIDVTATDASTNITGAVGMGGASTAAVQGSVATALTNKQVEASLSTTNIDKDATAGNSKITVTATNDTDIYTAAVVAAVSGNTAVGAGVGVNRIVQDTNANITGGSLKVANASLKTSSNPNIVALGTGVAGSGTVSVAGSFGVNIINNSTQSMLKNTTLNSTGNIGVVAESNEYIANYAGTASVSGTVAGGLSTTVNSIKGTTDAVVIDSTVDAAGSDDADKVIVVNSDLKDAAIISADLSKSSFVPKALVDGRVETKKTGLVIDSSSTHSILSNVITVAASGTAAGAGTVNVNTIGGSTTARLLRSTVNQNVTATGLTDVSVKAADYANAAGFTGSISGSMYAAVGAASDTDLINRTIMAQVEGTSDTTKESLSADQLDVQALSLHGISSLDAGAAAAIEGASIGGTISVAKLQSSTTADVKDYTVVANGADITADHHDKTYMVNNGAAIAAIGASFGLSAGVVDQESKTAATVTDSTITTPGTVKVAATAGSRLTTGITSLSAGGLAAGVAGTTAVNNMKSTVEAAVVGSTLTANAIDIEADNTVTAIMTGGAVSGSGLGGAGISVAVNTFNDLVKADVAGSTLNATGDVTVDAKETRDVKQVVVNISGGAVAGGANVMVTSVNGAISNDTAKNKTKALESSFTDTSAQTIGLSSSTDNNEQNDLKKAKAVTADYGGDVAGAGVYTSVGKLTKTTTTQVGETTTETSTDIMSSIKAGGAVKLSAEENSGVAMHGGNAVVGGVSLNGSVGILDVKHATKVNVSDATVSGNTVELTTSQGNVGNGNTLSIYQGSAGAWSIAAAYGSVSTSGTSGINISNSDLTATQDLTLAATDTSNTGVNAYGVTAGAVAIGAIVAQSSNDSTVGVTLDSTGTKSGTIKSLQSDKGNIRISADKNNTVKTTAVGGSVGIVSAVGIKAQASDEGSADVKVSGNQYTFSGDEIDLSATNRPEAVVWAGSASVGIDAAQATVADATINAGATMDIGADNTFKANVVSFGAQVGEAEKTIADTTVIGVGLGGVYSGAVNKASTTTNTTVSVNVGNENYTDQYGNTGITDLYVNGANYVKQNVDVSSLTVGGLLAVGAGVAETTANNTLDIAAKGGNVGSLTISANGTSDSKAHDNGDGGGVADVSLEAAKAVNTITNKTKAALAGNWTVAGTLSLGSVQNTVSNVQAEAVHVGAATVSGAKAETNIINGNTTAAIDDNASVNAKQVMVLAKNYITTGQDYDYAVDAKAYGGVAVNNDTTTAKIENNDTVVNIGANAKVDSNQAQTYEAATVAVLKNNINTTAGGAVDGAVATTSNTVTVNNSVNVGSGAVLTNSGTYADGGVTLSAYDTLNLTATADATTPSGLGGYVTALSSNSTTRNNKINFDGKIVSAKDINLYAGAAPDGSSASVNMSLAAAAYNHTAIPVKTKPTVNNTIAENNQVVVGADADGQAVRHINITADSGKTKVRKETSVYVWTKGTTNNDIEYVGNSVGVDTYNQSTDNFVQVDGSLAAGIKHNISITIEGNKVPEDCFLYGTTNGGSYTFTVSDQQIKDGITTGDADLANELFNSWKMYSNLIAAYGGKDISGNDLTAYTGYLQAKTQIEETMTKLGLAEVADDGMIMPIEGYTYNYVELPNITASGGNINVNSTNMKGSGSLTANGAPQVTINNTSTAYLKVNDITIGDQGGEIIFKDTSIGDGGNAKIDELNTNKTYVAAYKTLHTDDASGSAAAITISNSYTNGDIHVSANPDKLDASLTDEDKADILADTKLTYTPLSTVAIKGALNNALGEISINNKSGDIIIASDSTDSTALINAKKISLTASGSISQTSTDGIVNIGSTPEDVYAAFAKAQRDKILEGKDATKEYHDSATSATVTAVPMEDTIASTVTSKIAILNHSSLFYDAFGYKKKNAANTLKAGLTGTYKYIYAQALVNQKDTLDNTDVGIEILAEANAVLANKTNEVTGARIAGGSVYITASDINVNGLIQSGYSKYYANIAADALSDANLSSYQNDASRRVQVQGETMYKVNDGGRAVWQAADGNYAYEVQVYYNPSTGGLVVENIDAQGGKVYLNGRISSTGDGKILALDGGAQIQITNQSSATLNMGKVLNNNVAGLISITDANQDQQTLYTRNGTTTISNYSKSLNSNTANQSTTTLTSTPASYAVKQGLRYNWTEGTDTTTTQYYTHIVKQRLWGTKTVLDNTAMTDIEATITPVTQSNKGDKPTGTYIGTVTDASDEYTIIADNVINSSVRSPVDTSIHTVGPLKRKRTYTYTWNITTGSSQSYVHSLKADKSIDIGFIGQKDGAITISGAGDVNLNGNILNNSTAATLAVTASGTIAQKSGTNITSNVDSFVAGKGIEGLNIVSLGTTGSADLVKLNAVSTTGDIDAIVSGGFAGNTLLQGNVQLTQLTTGNGNVSLAATGNITQSGTGLTVKGNRIDLTSANGAIGTAEQAIVVDGGQTANSQDTLSASVNAQADDNIYLTQQSGDMRVGTIVSNSGDITLTAADGSLVDALPTGETVNNVDTNTLIQRWKDAGLIAGTGTYTKKLADDVTNYEANIRTEFEEYTTLKAYYDANPTELTTTTVDTKDIKHTTAAYTKLQARYKDYNTADEYLAQDSDYAALVEKRDHPTYEWTQNQLLYAIKDSIINKSVGTTDSELKQANVSGRNITLTAKNIGVDKPTKETISLEGIMNRETDLKKLANAEAADVTWDEKDKVAVIGGKVPLGINATGMLNVNSTGNAYMAGRSDSKENYAPLNVGTVVSETGDVRLLGKAGVTNALTTSGTNFKGHDLIVEGGTADIGASNKYVTVDLTGGLEARTDGSIYITSVNKTADLQLNAIYAGHDVSLTSDRSIIMDPAADALSYINAGTTLTLTADADNDGVGDVGTAATAVRVKANGAVVNATGNNLYLAGKDTGNLVLGVIDAKNGTAQITSDGSVAVGQEDVTGSFTAKTSSTIQAAQNITLSGPVKIGTTTDSQSLDLTATAGAITQTNTTDKSKGIQVDVLNATSNKGQNLQNVGNVFNTYNMQGVNNYTVNGDVAITTNAAKGLTADLHNSLVMGNVSITNLATGTAAGITIKNGVTTIDDNSNPGTIGGNVTVISDGTLVNNGKITAIGNVQLQSTSSSLTNTNAIKAAKGLTLLALKGIENKSELTGAQDLENEEIKLKSEDGDIINTGTVTSTKGVVSMNAVVGKIDNQKTVTSAQSVTLQAEKGITNEGTVTAQDGNVDMTSNTNSITNSGAVTAQKGSVNLIATKGVIDNQSSVKGSDNVTMLSDRITNTGAVEGTAGKVDMTAATGNIINSSTVMAGTDAVMTAATGIENTGAVTAGGKVELTTAAKDIVNKAAVTANGTDVLMTATQGAIDNEANVKAKRDVIMQAQTDIANSGAVEGTTGQVKLIATTGKIINSDTATAGTDAVMTAATGIENTGAVTAGGKVELATADKDIVNKAAVTAKGSDVLMTATNGSISNSATVQGMQNVSMTAHVDLTNTGAVEGTDGIVTMTAETGHMSNGNTVTAGTDANMTAATGIENTGAVTAGGKVELTTADKDIVNKATVTANGTDVLMTATQGAIDNEANVKAKRDVILQAQTDIANSGAVEGTTGQVKLIAETGHISNGNTVTAGTDAVMTAATGIENTGAVTAGGKVDLTTADKDIVNKAAVTANGTDVLMTAMQGAIDNEANVKAKRDVILQAKTDIINGGAVEGTTGQVKLIAGTGKITNSDAVTANTDAVMTAATGIENTGAVTAGGKVDLATADKDIVNKAAVTAKGSDVLMTATNGAVDNQGTVKAQENVNLKANTDISNVASIEGTSGNVLMSTKNGNIANAGDVLAGKDVTMQDDIGNISNNSTITAGTNVLLRTNTGNINTKKTVLAGDNVTILTENGKLQALGDITGKAGNVSLKATTGRVEVGSVAGDAVITAGNQAVLATDSTTKSDIEIYGDIKGDNGINLSTNVGDIIWHGHGTSANSAVKAMTQDGNIDHTGDITAGTDIIQQTKTGNITNAGNINAGRDAMQQTQTGNILDNGAVAAGQDVQVQTGTGNIDFMSNVTANRNINIKAGTGNITAADGTKVAALNGSATVSSNVGNITLHELYALKDAGVDAADGNVKLFRIEGENLLIAVRSPGKETNIDNAIAGKKLALVGDNITMDQLSQRAGEADMLMLSPRGTDSSVPMSGFTINNVVTDRGLEIDQLWTKNADIHVSSPKFYIDRLGVTNVAHLSNSDTTTTVWGSNPIRDNANTSYWYGPQNHTPWMFMYFTGARHVQFSNGVLLRNDDYYYPLFERFSGVNIAFKRADRSEHAYQQVDDYYGQEIPGFYYDMYDRYDVVESNLVPTAPTSEIIIES